MADFWDQSPDVDLVGNTSSPYVAEGATYPGNPWDCVRLGGMQVPGLCKVGAQASKRIQQKKQNGNDGATPTLRGYNPAKITLNVRIWTPAQYDAYKSLIAQVWPRAGKGSTIALALAPAAVTQNGAWDIAHPSLSDLGISSMIIEGVTALVPDGTPGVMTSQISGFQYMALSNKSATVTVKGGAVATTAASTTAAFKPAPKNAPAPPSQTDAGPLQSFQPAQGPF
jgi:hypothetical protein